jgi:hypothetical protein
VATSSPCGKGRGGEGRRERKPASLNKERKKERKKEVDK